MRPGTDAPATKTLFTRLRFDGFGPSRFHPDAAAPGGHAVRGKTAEKLRAGVRKHAPRRPGVYGMLDARGRLVYVGKAKNLRQRLMSYFRADAQNRKGAKIVRHTRTIVWEFAENEFAALLRELELIQRFLPRFNVLGVPGRQRYFFLVLGRPPGTSVAVSVKPTKKDLACYGPFFGRKYGVAAARRLNDLFRLRDCADRTPLAFADQPPLFATERPAACLRFELGTCLAPCVGHCSRKEYAAAARGAKAFLDGTSRAVIDDLTYEMTAAAAELKYEKASALRDKIADLDWLDKRLSLLRKARTQQTFVYPLAGQDGRPVWYVLHGGQVVAATREPACATSAAAVASLVSRTVGGHPPPGPAACQLVDSVLIVSAWFRKFAAERDTLTPARELLKRLAADYPPTS